MRYRRAEVRVHGRTRSGYEDDGIDADTGSAVVRIVGMVGMIGMAGMAGIAGIVGGNRPEPGRTQ